MEVYERVHALWQVLGSARRRRIGLEAARQGALEHVALSLIDDAPYPWTARQLAEAGMDNGSIGALVKAGGSGARLMTGSRSGTTGY